MGALMKKRDEIQELARMLFSKDGEFEVTIPGGDVFHVNCRPGVGMAFTRLDAATRKNTTRGTRRASKPTGRSI